MKTKPKQEGWEKEFDAAFTDGTFFFTGPVGSSFQPFLEWCKGLIRKTLQKERQEIREEVEKMKKNKRKFLESAKDESDLIIQSGLAYGEGFNEALDQVIKLLEDKDV